MAKKISAYIKLALPAGKATPAPPVGPALGQHGINIAAFCKEYNDRTSKQGNTIIPVKITVFEDRSYQFILKSPPASVLILKAANLKKGANEPGKVIIGSISEDDLETIATEKLQDLNTTNIEKAKNIIKGTAKNMGIIVN